MAGLIRRMFKRTNPTAETDALAVSPPIVSSTLAELIGRGGSMNATHAMSIPAVSANVDLISSMIASMPVRLYQRTPDGGSEEIEDGRVSLLNVNTLDMLSGYDLKKRMVIDFLLDGAGYCLIRRRGSTVRQLVYLPHDQVMVASNHDPLKRDAKIICRAQTFAEYEVIKFCRNSTDGVTGTGVVGEVSKALEAALYSLMLLVQQSKTGGAKKGFLMSERKLSQAAIDELSRAWQAMYDSGASDVVVLNNGISFKEASNTSVDLQLDQNRRTLAGEIDRIFHLESTDFWTAFQAAVFPVLRCFESALNRDLLLVSEQKRRFFRFDISEIVKADMKRRYDAYRTAKETGFLTINEIRAMEDLDPVAGLDVVNVGLDSVLFDTKTGAYYTPNTGTSQVVGDTIGSNSHPELEE